MTEIVLIGSNYEVEPFAALQDLVRRREEILSRIVELRESNRIRGAVLLTTCNRFEVLFDGDPFANDPAGVEELFGDVATVELRGRAAIAHVLRVATGIRSLVVGEDQILGQISRAFQEAECHGLLSKFLHMLRTRVLAAGRDIRKRAGLANTKVSVASVGAMRLIKAGSRLAVVGAGETGREALDVLARLGARDVLVVNRTLAKAEKLAAHHGYRACSLADFRSAPPAVDGVLLAISCPEPILTAELAVNLKVAVDVSMPSVLGNDLDRVPGLQVIRLDAIGKLASADTNGRASAVEIAEPLVLARAKKIYRELNSGQLDLGAVIERHVNTAMDELDSAFRGNLAHLSQNDQHALRQILDRLARRNAHLHIQDLKELVRQ